MMTDADTRFYREQGYLHVEALLTPREAAELRAECHALAARQGETDATWESQRSGGTRIEHCHDVQFRSAAFTRLLVDPRLMDLATALIGPNVQLHHNKMFIKPPARGSPFPMHQDQPYFPHEGQSMMAVILHLDDAPVEKGCVTVYPRSHLRGPQPATGKDHVLSAVDWPFAGATPVPARAGDAIVINYLTVHGSGVNISDEARTTLLVQLRDPQDRPLTHGHASRGQGMMLAGIDPDAKPFVFAWADPAAS